MPNLDDFYAFRNTSSGGSSNGSGDGFLLFISIVFALTLLCELISS